VSASGRAVAIIVPAYNAATTLAATLDTALAQDGVDEIVVVDDGSRDGTLAVACRYEPRVRVLTGPNQGVSAARNRGAAETTAPWLLFLDADDLLEPGTIEKRLATAKTSGSDVVICDWRDLIDDGVGSMTVGPLREIDWALLAKSAEIGIAVSIWATTAAILYCRELFQKVGGFREDLPIIEDARLLFDAAYHGAHFAHSAHIGAKYRIRQSSLSRHDPAKFWQCVLLNGQQIEALWRKRGPLDATHLDALADIYNVSARGLFAVSHPKYFDAVTMHRRLGLRLPRHPTVAAPVARVLGLSAAKLILSRFVRSELIKELLFRTIVWHQLAKDRIHNCPRAE
jgi:glycosyltransferase involved in cell wall biosynthesis